MTKRLLPLLFCACLYCLHTVAQPKNMVIVKAGHTIKESLTPAELYQYPQFQTGVVFLKDGKTATVPLNYNRFLDQVQYVTSKGDTLSLSNVNDVQYIVAGGDTLFYNNGFMTQVASAGDVKLAARNRLRIVSKSKISDGYGSTSTTNAVDVYDSYADVNKNYDVTVMEDVTLGNNVLYYVAKGDNTFVQPNKKSLLKLFPNQKANVETYLKTTVVNFNNQQDLVQLVKYLGNL